MVVSRRRFKKLKHVFLTTYKLYKKRLKHLDPSARLALKESLETTQCAILSKDQNALEHSIVHLESLSERHLRKNLFDRTKDFIGAIIFALVVAVVVRQMWFELYEIPTGSMRPTFKEQDRLVVSKTQFGINIPMMTRHFYFDPHLVKRGGVVVFTGDGMDIHDVNTLYFYVFPGKKQYIKRLIGKPGDTLYFYGGRIYGLDKNLEDISHELQPSMLSSIDHVPFISFEGKPLSSSKASSQGILNSVVLYQMNEPVAKLSLGAYSSVKGEMLPDTKVSRYEDLWGFKNYAMARILTKKEYLMSLEGTSLENLKPSDYYLELIHDPNLQTAKIERDLYGKLRPTIGTFKSYIPLEESHMKTLFENIYTARFIVDQDGFVRRYGYKKSLYPTAFLPQFKDVPPGTYEFYYGKPYQVLWQGITKALPENHPLSAFSQERLYTLFNLGIEFDTRFLPSARYPSLYPSRYAFYREGDLYVMGTSLVKQEDPLLKTFTQQELVRKNSTSSFYIPFIDHGIPNKETILQEGVKIPEDHYFVLGDNYAMSADSRDFGFVPESNLRGVPEFIFWPIGSRLGLPNYQPYPFFTLPRVIIWGLAAAAIFTASMIHRKKYRLPLSFN